jgi:hypothetical protein
VAKSVRISIAASNAASVGIVTVISSCAFVAAISLLDPAAMLTL